MLPGDDREALAPVDPLFLILKPAIAAPHVPYLLEECCIVAKRMLQAVLGSRIFDLRSEESLICILLSPVAHGSLTTMR